MRHPKCHLLFVDDGSTDHTVEIISAMKKGNPNGISLLQLNKNKGKATAVRAGMLAALKTDSQKIGYIDADLAVHPTEAYRLSTFVTEKTPFVFGSRIKKIDTVIERKWYRFLIGRAIATLISKMLSLPVYDTQCGGKVFAGELVWALFEKPFLSRWLFDVELFFRGLHLFGKDQFVKKAKEVPITQWIDTSDSKVPWRYGLLIWFDLLKIYRAYK